jgi:hypothetical protein
VAELLIEGLQVPVNPSLEIIGKLKEPPEHISPT